VITLPVGLASTTVTAPGKNRRQALHRASSLAEKLIESPILSVALPPGTANAVRATKLLAKYADKGQLGKALKKLTGKGAKRLVKKLKFW